MTPITIRYPVRPRARSLAAAEVAGLFDFEAEDAEILVADAVDLGIGPGDLALFVGPSGSGKSSLLRAAAGQLGAIDINSLTVPDMSIIDALPGPVTDRLALLASCGLAEARLALRTPGELSDGQRARYRLAYALATTAGPVAVDEFAALLDRPLARVLAYNLRRTVSRTGRGALVATTHTDLAEDLNPDVLIQCRGEGLIEVTRREAGKKASGSCRTYGCRQAPGPTGRTSLGGITGATDSAS
jgi:ABC-type ATPase with predicted acetyltransferase domain